MREVVLETLGASLTVDLSVAPEAVDEFRTLWGRCLATERGGVAAQPVRAHGGLPRDDAASWTGLTQSITMKLLEAQAGRLLLLHAGALVHPGGGGALVFAAPSGTGKTTLARTLGREWGYLTDETVGIDESGTILPYPKPLSLVQDAGGKRETSPDAAGLRATPETARVGRIVLLNRTDGEFRADELSTLDAIVGLTPESSSLSKLTRPLHRIADLIEATAPVVRYSYREVEQVIDHVTTRLFS